MRIGFIGLGKVGITLGRLWSSAGYEISAVYSRRSAISEGLAELVGAQACASPAEVVQLSDRIFLTVADDFIQPLAESLKDLNWSGKAIIHSSGVASLDKLQVLAEQGALVGSLHPAYPFADVESALSGLKGASFAIEASHPALERDLFELVKALNGQVIIIPQGGKTLYHAALVIASNYTVTLYALAEGLLLQLGADRASADNALNTLLAGTVQNLKLQGIPQALTGPLVRSDLSTIQAHLSVLSHNEALRRLYIDLARLSFPMLIARGIDSQVVEQLLEDDDG